MVEEIGDGAHSRVAEGSEAEEAVDSAAVVEEDEDRGAAAVAEAVEEEVGVETDPTNGKRKYLASQAEC